jgi:hypothetical protein
MPNRQSSINGLSKNDTEEHGTLLHPNHRQQLPHDQIIVGFHTDVGQQARRWGGQVDFEKYMIGEASTRTAPFTSDWMVRVHHEMFGAVYVSAGQLRLYDFLIPCQRRRSERVSAAYRPYCLRDNGDRHESFGLAHQLAQSHRARRSLDGDHYTPYRQITPKPSSQTACRGALRYHHGRATAGVHP